MNERFLRHLWENGADVKIKNCESKSHISTVVY